MRLILRGGCGRYQTRVASSTGILLRPHASASGLQVLGLVWEGLVMPWSVTAMVMVILGCRTNALIPQPRPQSWDFGVDTANGQVWWES
jgi:hypothetical protein